MGSREVTDAIIDCIKDVDKVMLQVEQPHIRYELGKYVAANASDVWDKVKALVDMQGWTAVLMRKYSLMEKALAAACETIEQIKKELPSVDVVLNGNSSEKRFPTRTTVCCTKREFIAIMLRHPNTAETISKKRLST